MPEDAQGMIIKYIYLDKPLVLGMKRNFCVRNATTSIIIHIDDDDVHFPKSIEFRVRALLGCKLSKNPELKKCEILGSLDMLIYYLNQEQFRYGMCRKKSLIHEDTMIYTKKFWETKPFNENQKSGEGIYFTEGREDQIQHITVNLQ